MPKNPLKFARRKSSGNVLEEASTPTPSSTSSFRVLERPEKINLNGGITSQTKVRPVQRPFGSPLQNLRGKSVEELGSGLGVNRGSGGTTNSNSSGYYESSSASARHSSTSTLPSSVDADREPEDEELFPRKSKTSPMFQSVSSNANEPLPPPPSFTTRAARALSFGQKQNRTSSGTNNAPLPALPPPSVRPMTGALKSVERSRSPQRERATTTSSYASTAKPEVNLDLGVSDFGDFTSLFDRPRSGSQFDLPLPPVPPVAAFHRTVRTDRERQPPFADVHQESEPIFPPRAHSRNNMRNQPEEPILTRAGSTSPYFERRGSQDALITASPIGSPHLDDAPPLPPHKSGIAPAFLGKSKEGYSLVPKRFSSPVQERFSHDSQTYFISDQLKDDDEDSNSQQDSPHDQRFVKRVELHDPPDSNSMSSKSSASDFVEVQTRMPTGYPKNAVAGASRSNPSVSDDSEAVSSLWASESRNTTPRAAKSEMSRVPAEESLFDSSPVGPPSRAIRPRHERTASGTPKRMTRQQFERLQRGEDSTSKRSEEDEQIDDEYDDEDDADRAKKLSRQRQKQEANMSVYRQQMKKVTGGGPGELPSVTRPNLDRAAASAPAIHLGGLVGQPPADAPRGKQTENDDEDVPLGILAAHGFPSSGRPPARQAETDAAQRRSSVAGGVLPPGSLPAFARKLPADPYFGSSLINQANREPLGLTSAPGTPSVHGGPSMPQMMGQPSQGHPGGLVGVIAGEERAKAARRGSPNPITGTYGTTAMPLPPNMPQSGFPQMPRSMSMGNVLPPQSYMPSGMGANGMMMPQMPMMQPQMPAMPNMQQDQMQQFMQMQMQVMQNMLTMQQQQLGQTPPPQPQPTQDYLGVSIPGNRRTSVVSNAPSIRSQAPMNQGRAMTMMSPPTRWDVPQPGQRPNSALPQIKSTYTPSGMIAANSGPGPGYSPSIAPSERSNIGMPSRYRPVTMGNDGSGRTNSMTSNLTLQPYGQRKISPEPPPPPPHSRQPSKSSMRILDRPKNAPKVTAKPVAEEDDEEGWAEMQQKREEKKKFRFGRRNKDGEALSELYQTLG